MSTAENRLIINLRIISALLPHQKLNAKAELLAVEGPTWIPSFLYRYWRGDARDVCLRRLEQIVAEAITAVQNAVELYDAKKKKKLLTHVYNCIPGFKSLKQTYADDATTIAKIELFIEQCKDLLTAHAFEPERMIVINELPESDDSTESNVSEPPRLRLGPTKGQEPWRTS